jgi:hypothetical protein
MKVELSRRAVLSLLASSGLSAGELIFTSPAVAEVAADSESHALGDFLTATLSWGYSSIPGSVRLEISADATMSSPIVSVTLADGIHSYRLAVAPDTTYFWRLTRAAAGENPRVGHFHTGNPALDDTEDDAVRYRNPRTGAHWSGEAVVPFGDTEPLSPWFDRKAYLGPAAPRFDDATKSRLPVPVMEGSEALLDLYWYCWKTFFEVWFFSPTAPDHQAVANIIGVNSWGPWGSTMVWDTGFMLHFARYGNAAYPFITALDNCYARQHENGFICRESDAQNREVYSTYPVNPPIFAWAEWEYYQISGDAERLRRVLIPIAKHYAWWMTYQRRKNGLYWNTGMGEGMDDSPRNELAYYTMSAAAEQALAALALSRIATVVGREDLAAFFKSEHAALGKLINDQFWDAEHRIYNDRTRDGRFITELQPGVYCKHGFIFWPLIAEVTDDKGTAGLIAELTNKNSFNRPSGVASLSADSKGYKEDGQYWRGSVWPPVQCIVQEGLRCHDQWPLARSLAERYLQAVLEAFQRDKTVTENLEPDSSKGHGAREFVGWGGIGPVSNLIEYVLGFQVNAPEKLIEWRIERTDRHGIQNLSMGKETIGLICERRPQPSSPCHITVHSSGECRLRVVLQDKITAHPINRGRNDIVVA